MAILEEFDYIFDDVINNSDPSLDSIAMLLHLTNSSNGSAEKFHYPFSRGERNVTTIIVLILAYSSLIVISIFGNALVCHVIFKNKRMHTVTNFFIANLAVSDLLVTALNVPLNIARNLMDEWPFGEVLCHLVNFSLMVSVYVSTFTLTGIALDRQQVLLYPLSPRITKLAGVMVLAFIWIAAISLSLPFGIYTKVREVNFIIAKKIRCRLSFPKPSDQFEQYLTISTFVLQYCMPLLLIGVTYGRIVRKLWARAYVGAVTANQQQYQFKAKRKSIKMLITVVVVFALCWMPLNLYHLLTDLHPNAKVFHYNSAVFFACHWLAISSTCYNPFVYCWLNENFRKEVKARFRCCFRRSQKVHPGIEVDGVLLREDCVHRRRVRTATSSRSSTSKKDTVERDEFSYPLEMRGPPSVSSAMFSCSKPLKTVPEENNELLPNRDRNDERPKAEANASVCNGHLSKNDSAA